MEPGFVHHVSQERSVRLAHQRAQFVPLVITVYHLLVVMPAQQVLIVRLMRVFASVVLAERTVVWELSAATPALPAISVTMSLLAPMLLALSVQPVSIALRAPVAVLLVLQDGSLQPHLPAALFATPDIPVLPARLAKKELTKILWDHPPAYHARLEHLQ